jgi:hypothetical protein
MPQLIQKQLLFQTETNRGLYGVNWFMPWAIRPKPETSVDLSRSCLSDPKMRRTTKLTN